VIHAVGPRYRDGAHGEAELLASAYRTASSAPRAGLTSLAFPAISTGIYHYPLAEAAEVSLRTVISYLSGTRRSGFVRFVLWDETTLAAYERELGRQAPG